MAEGSEKELQKIVLEWLEAHPAVARVWATDTARVRTRKFNKGKIQKGVVDIHGILRPYGRYFGIELKVGYNTPTPEQDRFLFDACNAGALAFTAWSLEEVQERFKASGLRA